MPVRKDRLEQQGSLAFQAAGRNTGVTLPCPVFRLFSGLMHSGLGGACLAALPVARFVSNAWRRFIDPKWALSVGQRGGLFSSTS